MQEFVVQYNCATQQLNLYLDLNSKALEGMGTDQSSFLWIRDQIQGNRNFQESLVIIITAA